MSKRKVLFNGRDEICPILDRHEYTAEEKASTWITSQDLNLIKKNMRDTVIFLIIGDERAHSNSESHCTRGLESFTPEAMTSKKRKKYESRRAVFDEQHHQFALKKCIHDPERLSREYMNVTESSRITARAVGILDAEHEWSNQGLLNFRVKPPKFETARSEAFTQTIGTKIRRFSSMKFINFTFIYPTKNY